jgi:D-aminopeptidase
MEQRPRARDAGVVIGSLMPGPLNAVTDVAGVRVGHATVWEGEPPGAPGQGPARTGVTAILAHPGNLFRERVFAGSFVLNGYGEIASRTIIDEWGLLGTPILLTNSMSLGTVYHAAVQYLCRTDPGIGILDVVMPVVGECDDGTLNDIRGLHVRPEHVWAALDAAAPGPVAEGCVGSGTGMQCFGFKGGIGTASRLVEVAGERHTVGVLMMTNYGERTRLTIAGAPVGRHLTDLMPTVHPHAGSCIVVVATDAPLHPQQLARLAKRSALGLARTGSTGADGSGEIMLAFSTAVRAPREAEAGRMSIDILISGSFRDDVHPLDELFAAAVDATEEAALNALFTAVTVTGRDGNTLHALPLDRTLGLLERHGVLARPA